MSDLFALLAALAAFAALCASMQRHQRDLFDRRLSDPLRQRLRIAGAALLVISAIIACAAHGAAYGLLVWFGQATLAAALVALMLNRRAAKRGRMP